MSLQSLNARSQTFNPCEHLRLYTINKGCDLMEALVLIGGLFYISAVGFWVTRRFSRSLQKGFYQQRWSANEQTPQMGKKTHFTFFHHLFLIGKGGI